MFLIKCEDYKEDVVDASYSVQEQIYDASAQVENKEAIEIFDLCKPCTSNKDCINGKGLCIFSIATQELFCSYNCIGRRCPDGFFCVYSPNLEIIRQCLPFNSEITCEESLRKEL